MSNPRDTPCEMFIVCSLGAGAAVFPMRLGIGALVPAVSAVREGAEGSAAA